MGKSLGKSAGILLVVSTLATQSIAAQMHATVQQRSSLSALIIIFNVIMNPEKLQAVHYR
jgi:hypothetical protein